MAFNSYPGETFMERSDGLRVRNDVAQAPEGAGVKVKFEGQDHLSRPDADERTSFRFFTNDERHLVHPHDRPDPRPYFSPRDRDLGQAFVTFSGPAFRLKALTLRVGPARMAVGAGARRASVSLQFFAVSGVPIILDLRGNPVPRDGQSRDKRADYIIGESYEPLWLVSGGVLPHDLEPLQWLRWELPANAPVLQPGSRYAFLVMFDQPARERELALANMIDAPHEFGRHGIRREGSVAQPWVDLSWVEQLKASLPTDLEKRLEQPPNTWGRPDVDTYRDLRFYIEGT
jgi:hypothetical protein